jgi:hypothetical protein
MKVYLYSMNIIDHESKGILIKTKNSCYKIGLFANIKYLKKINYWKNEYINKWQFNFLRFAVARMERSSYDLFHGKEKLIKIF